MFWPGYIGTELLVFIHDATSDRSSRKNYEVCRVILPAQIPPNAANVIAELHCENGR